MQIFVPVTLFVAKVLGDLLLNLEETNRPKRANELLDIISAQSPALIKAGQVHTLLCPFVPSKPLLR